MSRSRMAARAPIVALLVVTVVGVGVATAAAGGPERTQTTAGASSTARSLFRAYCGSCHKLKAARTKGTAGPNLDKRFKHVRSSKIRRITLRAIVNGDGSMPAGILTGRRARKVADYVAAVAGRR
jgi:mono/diheme cytochrome c family protein